MKRFFIIVNGDKEHTTEVKDTIAAYLTARGAVCGYTTKRLKKEAEDDGGEAPAPAVTAENTDCVITLGGDGTLIRAARDLTGSGIPIIGINLGSLGYLTEAGREDNLTTLLDALLEDRYQLQERMMLQGRAWHNGRMIGESIALNDIVLTREGALRVLKFKIYVDGQFLNEYSADGMIVATPTGSTAYNLSAGGPIAQPDGQLLIMTPICPHTLTSRSIVLGAENKVRIEISETNSGSQMAAFDGDMQIGLAPGDYIEIERSRTAARVVKLDHRSFLDILKDKMWEA